MKRNIPSWILNIDLGALALVIVGLVLMIIRGFEFEAGLAFGAGMGKQIGTWQYANGSHDNQRR